MFFQNWYGYQGEVEKVRASIDLIQVLCVSELPRPFHMCLSLQFITSCPLDTAQQLA